jgi:Kdo2-lipid IVA lauroyltransferase/acyltransferase
VKHRLEYWAVAAVTRAVRLLPWSVVRAVGVVMGLAAYFLDPPHRRITLANLEAAFPVRHAAERRRIARGVFAHFGRVLLELLKFSTLRPEQMLERVEFEGGERARQAYALGRGVLFFTGHFGYWELCGIVHAMKIGPIGVLARALDNPYLNRLLEQARQSTGNTVIYRRGALRRVMRALEANQGVAMLIDQHTFGPDAVYVDFFNRPAATTSSLAALALRTGAPAIPVFAIPLPGCRYRMIYEHPIGLPAPDSPDAIREFTQRCTDVLEMYVRRYPHLWLWMHRRWRDGEPAEHVDDMFPAAGGETGADPVGIDD